MHGQSSSYVLVHFSNIDHQTLVTHLSKVLTFINFKLCGLGDVYVTERSMSTLVSLCSSTAVFHPLILQVLLI